MSEYHFSEEKHSNNVAARSAHVRIVRWPSGEEMSGPDVRLGLRLPAVGTGNGPLRHHGGRKERKFRYSGGRYAVRYLPGCFFIRQISRGSGRAVPRGAHCRPTVDDPASRARRREEEGVTPLVSV